jgi:CMP/dCMP kinase
MSLIVTVDGPSGTGKSSVSRAVASRFGLPHLDTGAYYRAATVAVIEAGIDPDDPEAVLAVVQDLDLHQDDGVTCLGDRDVSKRIRDRDVSANVSAVSRHPDVRAHLVGLQREWVAERGNTAVVEGRDIGSVVFPDAEVKIYLDARPDVRAMRRSLQQGEEPEQVARSLARRDHIDSTRTASPLTVPEGAIVVDTSDMTFEEVVEVVAGLVGPKS